MSGSNLISAFCEMPAAGPVKSSLAKTEGDGKVKLSTYHVGKDSDKVAQFLKDAEKDAEKAFTKLTTGEMYRAAISVTDDSGLVSKASKPVQGEPVKTGK